MPPIALESKLLTNPIIVNIPNNYPIPINDAPNKQRRIFSKIKDNIIKEPPNIEIIIVIIILIICLILINVLAYTNDAKKVKEIIAPENTGI